MKNVEIVVDGKRYKVQMRDEQISDIIRVDTGYAKERKIGERYWAQDESNEYGVSDIKDIDSEEDENLFNNANYYTSEKQARDNNRADSLMRNLRRWQALNDNAVIGWDDCNVHKYFIIYDCSTEELSIDYNYFIHCVNVVYFSSIEKANEAIEAFKNELMWYFTEYQPRLDMFGDGNGD